MHFKSRPFPTSDAYSVPFLVFNRFPKDIGLEILAHCSPFDLAQLGMASRTLRGLISTHASLWIAAQGNVSGQKTTLPLLPVVAASGNYSQSAYALFIFGGGLCTAMVFQMDGPSALPLALSFQSVFANLQNPAQLNALDLETWKKEYVQAKAGVSRNNFEFIKKYSTLENRKFQGIMRCPTTARLFTAFNRDLDLVTHAVWIDNRAIILAELKAMLNGVLPEGTTGQKNDKLRCSYCPRLIAVKGMADHIVDKHKDRNPDKIPSIPSRDEKHCPHCPDSKRLFTRRGLRDHNLSKYKFLNFGFCIR
ncbi:hypothetical protein C8R47DRAFT_1217405 [Mycena vitilis]|nr:hypothetical protein C8R47DRAFT_1217405 [Mycena vitilis]